MLVRIVEFLKVLAFGSPITPEAVQEVPEEKKPFSIPFKWPFPSPKPENEEYLVNEMLRGVQTEGDHVYYFWSGNKRRHLRTPQGKETVLARNIVWWINGRNVPNVANGLTTTCGEQKCIKLQHLVLRMPSVPFGPMNRPKPVPKPVFVRKDEQPPLPPKIKPGHKTTLERFSDENRNMCETRKGYFADEIDAQRFVSHYNRPHVRGKAPRQYAYECTQCDGWHASKINPEKFGKKKVGAW
jgi:hypothetical protein